MNFTILENWWNQHHDMGGHVSYINDAYTLDQCCPQYTEKLWHDYQKISIEEKILFLESDVLDNSMPNRETLEDAAKIAMLVDAYQNKQLNFNVQLVQEPWLSRWRVHPGSGRYVAQWLCGAPTSKLIYIHFDEPEFAVPDNSVTIPTSDDFLNEIVHHKYTDTDFQTYLAFPQTQQDKSWTQDRDHEWNPPASFNRPWCFLRYSEGKHFLNYKSNWRSYVLDFNIDIE